MKLYAAGFNAWGQLSFGQPADTDTGEPDDMHVFSLVLEDACIDSVRPLLTSTEGTPLRLRPCLSLPNANADT